MTQTNLFQYCPKFVIFNNDFSQVLLCERSGEADFDKTYSFAGGKVENADGDIWEGMKREKMEELGKGCSIKLFTDICTFEYYIKKDGTHMILPHHICIYEGGDILISEEYSGYKWVDVAFIEKIELEMIPTVPKNIKKLFKYIQSNTIQSSDFINL